MRTPRHSSFERTRIQRSTATGEARRGRTWIGGGVLGALAVTAIALSACDGDTEPMGPGGDPVLGTADLTSYVAIGNSLAMGVLDGALLETGSRCSYPALLAKQAGLTDFELPLYADPGIVAFPPNEVGALDAGRMRVTSLQPLTIERQPSGPALNAGLARPYNNLGVSNALLVEALQVESASTSIIGNELFDVVFRSFGTWVEQATALQASFITLWLGINDVLIWAGAGGDASLAPGLPVPVDAFDQTYGALLDQLLSVTDQIVLFNIPDLTTIPLFTTLPPVLVDPATGQPVTDANGQPVPLLGPDGPLAPGDLVLLTASDLLLQGIGIPQAAGGSGQPLPDAVVLDFAEQDVARTVTAGYNAAIASEAAEHDLPVVDIAGLLAQTATTGVQAGGETLTAQYLVGGAFGVDGAHPTCKGYGLIANRLIETINAEYGAQIPPVSIAELEGLPLPSPAAAAGSSARRELRVRPAPIGGLTLPFGLPRFVDMYDGTTTPGR